jgi:hypothetical protein
MSLPLFFYALVAAGVIGNNHPDSGLVGIFPTIDKCQVAKVEYDKLENDKAVVYIGSGCIKIEIVKGKAV